MNSIHKFQTDSFINALKAFFKELKVPVNYISDLPTSGKEILTSTYKENDTFKLIKDVYSIGIIDDAAFDGRKSIDTCVIKSDYDGILLFGIELKQRDNYLLPTRNQLAEIARAFNKEYFYTPVVVVFKYDNYLAFANTERMQYKQEWREGEKVGKVKLLRDINISNVHSGHSRILQNLEISRSGKNAVNDFKSLYKYWQEVLSVSILNKVFYKELSNWYFWAIQEVRFPNEPLQIDYDSLEKYDEALKEHKGKNVIRLLTRLLFIWFIKEKGLIPEEIFDEKEIASRFIDGFTPEKPEGIFADGKHSSKYYRAILQNLFFATLNQPRGERQFRSDGKHLNATQLMRYRSYLKEPDYFVELMESKVPFMNGGLFECLDKPHPTLKGSHGGDRIIYVDGFSDRPDNEVVVPDFLFFDKDEELDLSKEYGSAKSKKEKTRGLFNILKSYKFTITENTPIDEDVALDPELLGKVFENLLASYNPETKTTARKQTGSFYTPREIVNYMVEESLIAYLKNELTQTSEQPYENLDKDLHQLVSFSEVNPFENNASIQLQIIKALDKCKILDPACGSGAYPMGILQKMVHILNKIDTGNIIWKKVQEDNAKKEASDAVVLENKKEREERLKEISDAFDQNINNPDYARKLYLIENCIYGVDIQPIATQISKLRFFISLVVDQKVDASKDNFGIRPLPNLETKFVAANTLIGLPNEIQGGLFDKREVKKLEDELKKVRHKLFSVKTPSIKRELRAKDKALREEMQVALTEQFGNETAQLLSQWDPYDQNSSSPFFDKEWMFDISDGFDIVIGNPPYVTFKGKEKVEISDAELSNLIRNHPYSAEYKINSYALFIEDGFKFLKNNGNINYIIPSTILQNEYLKNIRKHLITNNQLIEIVSFENKVFDAVTDSIILIATKGDAEKKECKFIRKYDLDFENNDVYCFNSDEWNNENYIINLKTNKIDNLTISKIEENCSYIDDFLEVYVGVVASGIKRFLSKTKVDNNHKKYLQGKHLNNYSLKGENIYINFLVNQLHSNTDENVYEQNEKILVRKTGNILMAYLDNQQYYTDQSIYNLFPKRGKNLNLKFFTALLNSRLLDFYFNKKMITNADVFPYIKGIHLKKLPVKLSNDDSQFNLVINKIISQKKLGINTSALEHQIDVMVYHLYELSYEEACVIDEGLSKEDFERYRINK